MEGDQATGTVKIYKGPQGLQDPTDDPGPVGEAMLEPAGHSHSSGVGAAAEEMTRTGAEREGRPHIARSWEARCSL